MTRRFLGAVVLLAIAAPAARACMPGLAEGVRGQLYTTGGPYRRHGPAQLPAGGHWRVVARSRTKIVASTMTKPDSSFAFRLKPGTYEMAAQYQFPPYRFCSFKSVTVRPSKVANVRLDCSIR